MSIFPNRSRLSDPTKSEAVADDDYTYVITRARLDAFNAVHAELDKAGLPRKSLAKRLGMDEGQLSRLLGSPGNWRLETIAKLFWAISGGRVKFALDYPMQKGKRNNVGPWPEPELKILERSNTSTSSLIRFEPGTHKTLEPV